MKNIQNIIIFVFILIVLVLGSFGVVSKVLNIIGLVLVLYYLLRLFFRQYQVIFKIAKKRSRNIYKNEL